MDLVYAFSVLTHLSADIQAAWLRDLHASCTPGGRLLVTTHGEAYAETLTREERAAFEAGEPMSRFGGSGLEPLRYLPSVGRDAPPHARVRV